jgi:hypothetical protein
MEAVMSRRNLTEKMRQRRDRLAFERALRTASPSMQQELIALATQHVR